MPVLDGAQPFDGGQGPVGVLLIHGFTGSPASMRPWAEHLVAAGMRVKAPRLPGHGTRWQDLNVTRWPDWYAEAQRGFRALQGECDRVFAGGLSVGGALTLRLAEQEPALAGAVVVNSSLGTDRFDARFARFLAPLIPSFPGVANDIKKPGQDERGYNRIPLKAFVSLQQLWKVTVADLGAVSCPVLSFRSQVDHVVEPTSGRLLAGGLRAPYEEVVLENSYHVATLDNDAPMIFDRTVEFIGSHSGRGAPAG